MNKFKTRKGEGEIHPYNNMLNRQTLLSFILTKEKIIHWTSWSSERQIFSGECRYDPVVSYWGLVFCIPTASSKNVSLSLDRRGQGSAELSVLLMCPIILAFWYGWLNKLTPTILTVPIYVSMSSKRPREFKSYRSCSPAAVGEFYGYSISRRNHGSICCLVDCFMSIFISSLGCGDCM